MLSPARQQGFTLLEVMVTVFIVAIGLLGAAALQALSKKAAVDAMQRTTASVLAQDMLERIRSNSGQIALYASTAQEITEAPAAVNCGDPSAQCSSADLVSYDIARWMDGLTGAAEVIGANGSSSPSGGLRSPVGCIRSAGNVVEVIIAWRGLTAITQGSDAADDPTNSNCGQIVSAAFTSGAPSGQSFRRVLRLQAHIYVPTIP